MASIVIHLSCENGDQAPSRVGFSFDDRVSVLKINAEPGRIKYSCEEDSILIYVFPDNNQLPDLIINDPNEISAFLKLLISESFNGSRKSEISSDCFSLRNNLTVLFDIRVIISGEIKESLKEDSFYETYAPFIIDSLVKVKECEVLYEQKQNSYPLVNTYWKFIDIIIGKDTLSPTCEYNNVGFGIGAVDDYLSMGISSGVSTCDYKISVDSQSLSVIEQNICILAIPNATKDMWDFDNSIFNVLTTLDTGGDSIGFVSYTIENNLLTLINEEKNSRIRLFAD